MSTPLAVLDLVPVSSGSSAGEAVRNAIHLARRAESFGYQRYWFAEHHLNPGVIGVSPAVSIALVAGATATIRLGSAGVQLGHHLPLAAVEEFGLIAALHPGRLDLGLGRSLGRPAPGQPLPGIAAGGPAHESDQRAANGLLLPKKFDHSNLLAGNKIKAMLDLLQQPNAYTPGYATQIDDVQALIAGTYVSAEGLAVHAYPGEGADLEIWILGASGGESATVAGERGLRFAASYHHSPSTVLDAVEAYRSAFKPSANLDRPYVSVSADVVVADDDETARRLASGYGPWVRSIRTGAGAIPYPTPAEAAALTWTQEERALVKDRVDTQLVGSAATVADQLEQLRAATGADELAITTITHRHEDRVRSYELLATEWSTRERTAR
jgi:alkanesulfonate monooxygenase SsuD/methylene tetrahydromethanopterin reductase-like flavin-dependent oxidoreductase (luciferase family)